MKFGGRGTADKTINWVGCDAWDWTCDQFSRERIGLDETGSGVYPIHHVWPWEGGVLHKPPGSTLCGEGLGHLSEEGQGPSEGLCVLLSPLPSPSEMRFQRGQRCPEQAAGRAGRFQRTWTALYLADRTLPSRASWGGSEVEFLQDPG